MATPQITSTPSRNLLMNSCISFISSIISSDDGQKETFNITFLALKISLLLSNGECRASSIAFVTRFSPSPNPVLMIATPPSFRMVFTSAKSRLTVPRMVIISAILLAAMERVSSALPKAFIKVRSAYISRRRSLLITNRASTCWAIRSTPSSAWMIFFSPSKIKGMVTIPTVRISISFAMRAMTGAAPVPVPPPIPAVMNTILVPSFSCALISSILSSAASRARSGRLPAPSPCVMLRPSCSFTGTGDSANAWLSVLQRTNVTSWMPSRYMWFTALPPPPPTPITLMIFGESVGKSNCTISSIII